MGLDWLVDPKVPAMVLKPPVLEYWGPEFEVKADPQEVLADGTRPVFANFEAEVVKAWRQHKAGTGRYLMVYHRGRAVKAVHLPDCCTCQQCHPEFHGPGKCMCHWPMPRVHAPGRCFCDWHQILGYKSDVSRP